MKHKHGPVGQSCLTCRHRRKKCDRGRPICERCRVGSFDCLGYDCEETPTRLSLGELPREPVQPRRSEARQHTHSHRQPENFPPGETIPMQDDGGLNYDPLTSPYVKVGDLVYGSSRLPTVPRLDDHGTHASANDKDNSTPYPPVNPVGSLEAYNTMLRNTYHPTTTERTVHPASSSLRTTKYTYFLPQTLSGIPGDMLGIVGFVLKQYDRLFSLSYFKPAHQEILRVRATVIQRLLRPSDKSRWVLVLGAKIIDAFLDGTLDHKSDFHRRCISLFEQDLQSKPDQQLSNYEVECRLTNSMEIAFFKLRITDINPYHILRSMVPTFLQIAYSDSTLWPNQHDLTAVSVAHILASDRQELGHFIYLDSLCSMAYGMPQVLEYDTFTPPFGSTKLPAQLCLICPAALQFALIDMNKLCGQSYIGERWRSVEQRILDWEAPILDTSGIESWKVITHLAIEETWRQTLLIYLYMAVCGVSSDDPRVQSSVRQIFRLIESTKDMKGQTVSFFHQYFFMQYIAAGVCTRFEHQRALARERLADTQENGLCLLRGFDFVPVLDHLWHGAAANGRAIRWSDYIISRQTVIPIDF